jgi:hypothetical protein
MMEWMRRVEGGGAMGGFACCFHRGGGEAVEGKGAGVLQRDGIATRRPGIGQVCCLCSR